MLKTLRRYELVRCLGCLHFVATPNGNLSYVDKTLTSVDQGTWGKTKTKLPWIYCGSVSCARLYYYGKTYYGETDYRTCEVRRYSEVQAPYTTARHIMAVYITEKVSYGSTMQQSTLQQGILWTHISRQDILWQGHSESILNPPESLLNP